MDRHTRAVTELWPLWRYRAQAGIHPFQYTHADDVQAVLTGLDSYDRDAWAAAFSAVAGRYQARAEDAEQNGDTSAAHENYLRAYGYYRLARYPTTNSAGKKSAYRNSQDMLLRASRYVDIPVERVEIPFAGRPGERDRIIAHLRVPTEQGYDFTQLSKLLTWRNKLHQARHQPHSISRRPQPMPDTKTIALVSFRLIENGDIELAQKIIAPDFVNQEADDDPEDVERQQHGAAGFLATSQWLRNAFANLRFEHQETLAEGDTVIAVSTMTGEHTGVFNGIQPTGKHIEHKQVHIFSITDGQITRHRAIRDDLGLLLQLGWRPGGVG